MTKADVYKSASEETVKKLSSFLTALKKDRNNFNDDFLWLREKVIDKSIDDVLKDMGEIEKIRAKLGLSTEKMEEIKKDIKDTLNRIKGWNIGAATISGKKFIDFNNRKDEST